MAPLEPSVTWMVNPATVKVPVRTEDFGLLATKKVAVPGPVTELPEVTLIQETLLTAVQEQAGLVETRADPSDPPEAANMFPRVTLKEQDTPAWVTGKDRPAMVRVPERGGPLLAASE